MGLKILGNCRGGITIFQCLIFTALLMFTGVIIDAARIAVAERKVQNALNTSVRSSLAFYDSDIAGDYGLFAVNAVSGGSAGGIKLNESFKEYFNANLSNTSMGYQFIKYRVDEDKTLISGNGRLLSTNPDTFKEQIIKYMKYRAPITITGNVIEKFKSSGIFQKLEFSQKEKEVRGARKELKGTVENVNKNLGDINQGLNNASRLEGDEYIEKIENILGRFPNAIETVEEIGGAYEKYAGVREKGEDFAEEANKDEAINQEGARIQNQEKEFKSLLQKGENTKSTLVNYEKAISEALEKIKPIQERINSWKREKDALEDDNTILHQRLSRLSGPESGDERQSIQESIRENNKEISRLKSDINNAEKEIKKIREAVDHLSVSRIDTDEAADYGEEKPKGQPDFSKIDILKGELEGYLGKKVISDNWIITPEEFQQADEDEKEFMELIAKSNRDKRLSLGEEDEDRAENDNNTIIDFLKKLKDEVIDYFSQGSEASIEKLYITEYIMDKFTYHSSETEREHYFKKGEVEYVLWGSKDENENIASTLKSIGFIRLAINTIDYFATSKVPHPVLRLVYSVGRGLLQSVEDTYQLYKGKEIFICPSLKDKAVTFKLNYSDHLRMFLLIQSVKDENNQLNNLRQLVQVNMKQIEEKEDFKLGEYYTRVSGKAAVRINLLFLPALHLDKLNIKGFDGGSYIIEKECHMGY